MAGDSERIGVLESKIESVQHELAEHKYDNRQELVEIKKDLDVVVGELREIRLFLSKWKGFVGGIAAVVSIVWAGILYITNYFN